MLYATNVQTCVTAEKKIYDNVQRSCCNKTLKIRAKRWSRPGDDDHTNIGKKRPHVVPALHFLNMFLVEDDLGSVSGSRFEGR